MDDMTAPASDQVAPNQVLCPTCGDVRLETPAGTRALPTFGLSMKAARGAAGTCDCGRRHVDDDGEPIGDRTP